MHRLLAAVFCVIPLTVPADVAGEYDYFVLSLSWSPNWCAREGDARGSDQCDARHDHGWILHGLWPQYEKGYPSYCQTANRPPSRQMTRNMSDIMGTAGLAWHQWKKHGTCTNLPAADYFDMSRRVFEQVTKPPVLRRLTEEVAISPDVIEAAFLRSNPELNAGSITITCKAGYIQEARICLTKSLEPRECGVDVRRDCSLKGARFAPVR